MKKYVYLGLSLAVSVVVSYLSCGKQALNATEKSASKLGRESLISSVFPNLKAQTLAGQDIVFPNDVQGKPTVICIAFVGDAQSLIDTWATPISAKYPNQTVNYYEIPMITTAWSPFSSFIDGGMRSGVPKDLHKNVATYYGSLDAYKKDLLMPEKESCYVFVLDKKGVIRYVNEYVATAEKLDALYAVVAQIDAL